MPSDQVFGVARIGLDGLITKPVSSSNVGPKPRGASVTLVGEDIYSSPNGDRWRLFRDATTGNSHVRHEANPASGGYVTETEVKAFLEGGGVGPEHAALRRLLAGRDGTGSQD